MDNQQPSDTQKRNKMLFYRMVREHIDKVITLDGIDHINVIHSDHVMPGAVTREATVRQLNEWSTPLQDDEEKDVSCFEVPDFLVGCVANARNGVPYPPLPDGWRKITDPKLIDILENKVE